MSTNQFCHLSVLVSQVADYLVDPTFASPKIRPNKEIADIQATIQGINIGLMTALPAPKLMNDFSHLLLDDGNLEQTRQVMASFQSMLAALSEKIEARNKERDKPCNSFNPKYITSSISI